MPSQFALSDCKSAVVHETTAGIRGALLSVLEARQAAKVPACLALDDEGLRVDKSAGIYLLGADPSIGVPPLDDLKKLTEARGIAWKDSYASRFVPYWVSDETVDSYGDIVRQNWDFSMFESNAPMPVSHNWAGRPAGQYVSWEVKQRAYEDYSGPALWALGLFVDAETSPAGDETYRLVKAGFLRGCSAGFRSRRVILVENEEERRKLGLGRYGVVLDDNLIYEASPCLIGACKGALAIASKAKAAGVLTPSSMTMMRELVRRQPLSPDAWKETDRQWRLLSMLAFPEVKGVFRDHSDRNEPFLVEDENEALRRYAPKAKAGETQEDRLAAIEARLDSLEGTITQGFAGTTTLLEDLRTLLEDDDADPSEDEPDEESTDDSKDDVKSSRRDAVSCMLQAARSLRSN